MDKSGGDTDASSLSEESELLEPLKSIALQEIMRDLQNQLQLYGSIISSKMERVSIQNPTESEEDNSLKTPKSGPNPINPLVDLEKEVSFLLKTVKATKTELETANTFTTLGQLITEKEYSRNELALLKDEVKKKQEKFQSLGKSLEEEEKQFHKEYKEKLCRLNDLKDQVQLAKKRGEEDRKFVESWLSTRNNQEKNVKHRDEIAQRKDQIANMELHMERDCTAYENVVEWTKLKSYQLDKQMQEKKEKFSNDILILKERIERKKLLVKGQEEKISELDKLIRKQVEELIPWEEEKEQERLERIQHMRRYYSCRKLQRWWRKHMVQHGLYRKKKQKAKPKAKTVKGKAKSPKKST